MEKAPSTTTTTTATSLALDPEYASVYEGMMSKLKEKIPPSYSKTMLPLLSHFAKEYMHAHQDSYHAGNTESTDPVTTATRFMTCVQFGLTYGMPHSPDVYTFDVSHNAIRSDAAGFGHVDFYRFGCDFFHSCMDLDYENYPETNVLGMDNLKNAMQQIQNGENVVFLANHQSEADPQVTSSCLELAGYGQAAGNMIYVAGHKVTTDPLAIPFSMGRNLICIHSKKHINADPETKPKKQRQNLKAMNALLRNFKQGGALVWVAPSGGRDRRDLQTGNVPIAPFDSKTIDMFRLMGNKAGVPTHFYTLAMVTYDLCPPPDTIEATVGESRNVRFAPVGIYVGNELDNTGGLETRHMFCEMAMEQCEQDYERLQKRLQEYAAEQKEKQANKKQTIASSSDSQPNGEQAEEKK
jgi:glycerol-3-phosphate O-acyltransferase